MSFQTLFCNQFVLVMIDFHWNTKKSDISQNIFLASTEERKPYKKFEIMIFTLELIKHCALFTFILNLYIVVFISPLGGMKK